MKHWTVPRTSGGKVQSIHGLPTIAGVSLISDDNNIPNQFTRVLNLVAILP